MITKSTASLGVSLYLFGCEVEEVDKFVECIIHREYVWYKFENRDLQQIYNYVEECKREDKAIAVDDFFKVEHMISACKRMCKEYRLETGLLSYR